MFTILQEHSRPYSASHDRKKVPDRMAVRDFLFLCSAQLGAAGDHTSDHKKRLTAVRSGVFCACYFCFLSSTEIASEQTMPAAASPMMRKNVLL